MHKKKIALSFGNNTTNPVATEETNPATDDLILDLDGGIELDD